MKKTVLREYAKLIVRCGVKYPESYKKLEEMKKILRKQRYVSFIN